MPKQERACYHAKLIYPTQREAASGVRSLIGRSKLRFHYYFCRACQGYHIGRLVQDKRVDTRRKEEHLPVRGSTGEDED